jgi:hypothetical protein
MSVCYSSGYAALRDPQQNLDAAFDEMQRQSRGLVGLLPPREQPLSIQAQRALKQLSLLATPLDKYMYLMALQVCAASIPAGEGIENWLEEGRWMGLC